MTAWCSSPRDRAAGIMDALAELRLPPADVLELRYYFNAYEADIGIHSLHYAQFDAMLGFQNTGAVLGEPQVEPRACEARRRGNKVYRVLARMIDAGASSSVTVLHRIYGPRCPHARYDEFRDLAPIATYTPVVEALAERMTRALRMTLLTQTMETLGDIDEFAKARVCDGVRERVSPEQALSTKLEKRPRRTEKMTNGQFAELRKQHGEARKEFVWTVMRESDQLLVNASHAYRRAKDSA